MISDVPQGENKEDVIPVLPKKRGRKPKNRETTVEIIKTIHMNETKTLKKDTTIFPSPKKMPIISKIENTILYFPIRNKETKTTFNDFVGNDQNFSNKLSSEDPAPYDPNVFFNVSAEFDNCSHSFAYVNNQLPKNKNLILNAINKNIKIVPILNEFIVHNQNKSLPEKTNICCFWDTEPFDWEPLGMPEKKIGDTFYTKGCFCSFECVASYNFSLNDEKVWERFALINLMCKKSYNINQNIKVELAPPREAHVKFGGIYSTEQFRNLCTNKTVKLQSFPIINIQCYLEEINNKNNLDNLSSTSLTQSEVKTYLDKINSDYRTSKSNFMGNVKNNTLEICMGLKKV